MLLYGRGAKSVGEQIGKSKEEAQEIIDKFFTAFPTVKQWIEDTKHKARTQGYVNDWYGRRRRLPDINLPEYDVFYEDGYGKKKDEFNPFLGCADKELNLKDSKIENYFNMCKKTRTKKEVDNIKAEAAKDHIVIESNSNRIAKAERQAVNSIVQGGAATLTKMAMNNIYRDKELNDMHFHMQLTVHDEIFGECPDYYSDKVSERLATVMVDTAKPYMEVPMACDTYNVKHWYEDEYAVVIISEYKSLTVDKHLSREEALDKIADTHCENSREYLENILKEIN